MTAHFNAVFTGDRVGDDDPFNVVDSVTANHIVAIVDLAVWGGNDEIEIIYELSGCRQRCRRVGPYQCEL